LNLKGLGSRKVPHSSRCFVGYPTSQVQEVLSNPVLMMSARYLDGDVTQPLVSSLFCSIQLEVVDAGLVCESLWFQVVSLLCRHCEGVMRAVQRSSWCLPTSSRRTTTKRTPETLCAPWPFSGEFFESHFCQVLSRRRPAHLAAVDDLTELDLVTTPSRDSIRSSCSVRSGMWRGLRRVQWPCASSCATPVTGSCSSTRCRAAHASQRVCEQGCPRRCDPSSHWCVCVRTPTPGLRARVLQSRCVAIWAFACRTPCPHCSNLHCWR
jgi:hypothetical protein